MDALLDGYELDFDESFAGNALDESRWVPRYLPQWSTGERSAARYEVADGSLKLLIERDQPAWCPEWDGEIRVSSLQTGVFAGPVGSEVGQQRFNPAAVVRSEQENVRLYTPHHGVIAMRAKALADPLNMVALWMVGYEDEPERSGEICVAEVFGSNVEAGTVGVGMGIHPVGDPQLTDEFSVERLSMDVAEFHVYAAEWTPGKVRFFVDDRLVKTVDQAPDYPMQLMLGIYEFPDAEAPEPQADAYPKEFAVDWVRGYRPVG